MTDWILILGGIHAGHRLSITPEKYKTIEGFEITPNAYQKWLRGEWNKDKEYLLGNFGYPKYIVILGEPVEGNNYKEYGRGLTVSDAVEQIDMCISLIEEWIGSNTDSILILKGSDYHRLKGLDIETEIAKRLKAKYSNKKIYSKPFFDIEIDNKKLFFYHGASQAFVYRCSALEREIKFAQQAFSTSDGVPLFDLAFQAHWHVYCSAENKKGKFYSVPCWKLMDEYAAKRAPYRFIPDIGLMSILFLEELKKLEIEGQDNKDYPLVKVFLHNPPFRNGEILRWNIREIPGERTFSGL